jgi:hypothetical protein
MQFSYGTCEQGQRHNEKLYKYAHPLSSSQHSSYGVPVCAAVPASSVTISSL